MGIVSSLMSDPGKDRLRAFFAERFGAAEFDEKELDNLVRAGYTTINSIRFADRVGLEEAGLLPGTVDMLIGVFTPVGNAYNLLQSQPTMYAAE